MPESPRVAAFLDGLPAAARAAYAGRAPEYRVDPPEYIGSWPEWCDDCKGWHRILYGFGVSVEAGLACYVTETSDGEGDHDQQFYDVEEYDEAEPTVAQVAEWWAAYHRAAAETGQDPLAEYFCAKTPDAVREAARRALQLSETHA